MHFVQYSGLKHARILFGILASPQDYLVFCSVMQQTHQFALFAHHVAILHVLGLFHSTGLLKAGSPRPCKGCMLW